MFVGFLCTYILCILILFHNLNLIKMSELQKTIDSILASRSIAVEKLSKKKNKIANLQKELSDLNSILEKSDNSDAKSYIPVFEKFIKRLENADEIASHLEERFKRDTINIGVAGFTHAGKSTFLGKVSGLDNNAIPKADDNDKFSGKPTTATRSQIYNSPNKYADIFIRSQDEFLEYVNNYVESLGLPKADSLSSFKGINFDEIDVEAFGDNKDSVKLDIARIKGIQEAVPYFESNLRNSNPVKISGDNFNELKQYVAYSYEDSSKRMYPAVREVRIYSPFAGIDPDLKIGLIDLPGFGEHSNVTKKTLNDIKNDVDSVIILYRPGLANYELLDDEKKKFRDVLYSQPDIRNKADFVSFLINKDSRIPEDYINKAKGCINDIWPDFKVRVASSNNDTDVEAVLSSVVKDLATSLSKMDDDLVESFDNQFGIEDISKTINEFKDRYQDNWRSALSASQEDRKKALEIRNAISTELNRLDRAYRNDLRNSDFYLKIEEVKSLVKSSIEERLLYPSIEGWYVAFTDRANVEKNNYRGFFNDEAQRLYVQITYEYEKVLNSYFYAKIEKLREEVTAIFKKYCGLFITKDGLEGVNEVLFKIRSCNQQLPITLEKSFEWLLNLVYDFKQNALPTIVKNRIDSVFEDAEYAVNLIKKDSWDDQVKENLESLKQELEILAIEGNAKIAKAIEDADVSNAYLYVAIHNFNEALIRGEQDTSELSFENLFNNFKAEIICKDDDKFDWNLVAIKVSNVVKSIDYLSK